MRGVYIVGLVLLAVASAGVAAANQPPMAEAGLYQEAVVNQTVYLDAGGSLDPDGEIVEYDWSIETPGGNTTVPDCPSCAQTHFVPRDNGTYAVTVTVRDDDGVSMDDTMYVRVDATPVQNKSEGGEESRETAGPAPSSRVGGGARGFSMALDSVGADSNGNKYLMNRDGGDFIFHTRDGETVEISQERFNAMAGEDGRVEWDQAKHEFRDEGVTEDDIDDSMEEGTCGAFTCASVSDRSGEENDFSDYDIEKGDLGFNADTDVTVDSPASTGGTLSPI